jgi:hypothetical protein
MAKSISAKQARRFWSVGGKVVDPDKSPRRLKAQAAVRKRKEKSGTKAKAKASKERNLAVKRLEKDYANLYLTSDDSWMDEAVKDKAKAKAKKKK